MTLQVSPITGKEFHVHPFKANETENAFYGRYDEFIYIWKNNLMFPWNVQANPNNIDFSFSSTNMPSDDNDYKFDVSYILNNRGSISIPPRIVEYAIVLELNSAVPSGVGDGLAKGICYDFSDYLLFHNVVKNESSFNDYYAEGSNYSFLRKIEWSFQSVKT